MTIWARLRGLLRGRRPRRGIWLDAVTTAEQMHTLLDDAPARYRRTQEGHRWRLRIARRREERKRA